VSIGCHAAGRTTKERGAKQPPFAGRLWPEQTVMSNLLNASLPSEDEEDQDYVPDEVDVEERGAKSKKPKRLRGAAAGASVAAGSDAEAGGSDASGLEDNDELLPQSKREAKKARVDALWSQLNRAAPAAGPASKAAGTASLASLCKPAGSRGKASASEVLGQGKGGCSCLVLVLAQRCLHALPLASSCRPHACRAPATASAPPQAGLDAAAGHWL
jgi:hypothetical protein